MFLDYTGLTKFWEKVKYEISRKQNVISFGDGVTVSENMVSVTTPVKEVTKEQYDAMSEQDKNSGLYVVTGVTVNLRDQDTIAMYKDKPVLSPSVLGVSKFNGRDGDVAPQSGDYTAEMVGAATMEQVNNAINVAITGAIEEAY